MAVVQLGVEQATTEKLLVFPQNLLHSPIAVTVCNYAFTHRIPPVTALCNNRCRCALKSAGADANADAQSQKTDTCS